MEGTAAAPARPPIFYPVLTFDYAAKIARDWNSTREDADFTGYVTRFDIDDAFAARYAIELAGGMAHKELRIPVEELTEFNRHIVGKIEVVGEYSRGERAEGRR